MKQNKRFINRIIAIILTLFMITDMCQASVAAAISDNSVSGDELTTVLEETSVKDTGFEFPGMDDDYVLSEKQLERKMELSDHYDSILMSSETEVSGEPEYVEGEVICLADTEEEANLYAAAFGGELNSFGYSVANIKLPQGATVIDALDAAKDMENNLPAVWPNNYMQLASNYLMKTNDPLLDESNKYFQWQHAYIGDTYAWAEGIKGDGITVGVIDTGIDVYHEDLSANVKKCRDFTDGKNGNEIDFDDDEHGTHVSGIICADENNAKGGAGIAPNASVIGYRVQITDLNGNKDIKMANVARSIDAAVLDGCDVINISLTGAEYNGVLAESCKNAYEHGIAIFAASGNDYYRCDMFPAGYKEVIAVSALDKSGNKAQFANYGAYVDLCFPGVDVWSTVPMALGRYGLMSGTSQATPVATGIGALILSSDSHIRGLYGSARVEALRSKMKKYTVKCSDPGTGAGTTIVPKALGIATMDAAPPVPSIEGINNGEVIRDLSAQARIAVDTLADVDVYYTLNGKTPTIKNGVPQNDAKLLSDEDPSPYVFSGNVHISGAKKVTLKAVTVNRYTGMMSKVASKTVTFAPTARGVVVYENSNISNVVPGGKLQMKATVVPDYSASNKVLWTLSDDAKNQGITINASGLIKVAPSTKTGRYTVRAQALGSDGVTFNGAFSDYEFNVLEKSFIKSLAWKSTLPKNFKWPVGAFLNPSGEVDIIKEDGTKETNLSYITWFSSDPSIATVTSTGTVEGHKAGSVKITAIANDGSGKSISFSVKIEQPVNSVDIKGASKVAAGKKVQLKADVMPANATNKKLKWEVVGRTDVSVNNNGLVSVSPSATGNVTVKATALDGYNGVSKTFSFDIVSDATKAIVMQSDMTLFTTKGNFNAPISETLVATIDGADNGVTFTSSAPGIAKVTQLSSGNKAVVVGLKPGKTKITCTATDGSGAKAVCNVSVKVPASSLSIGKEVLGETPNEYNGPAQFYVCIAEGCSNKLKASFGKSYGNPTDKGIEWSSEDESIIKVDKNGKITGVRCTSPDLNSNGFYAIKPVKITAKSTDGSNVYDEINVICTPRYKKLVLEKNGNYVMPLLERKDGVICPVPEGCIFELNKSGFVVLTNPANGMYVSPTTPTANKNESEFINGESYLIPNKFFRNVSMTAKMTDGSKLSAKRTFSVCMTLDKITLWLLK